MQNNEKSAVLILNLKFNYQYLGRKHLIRTFFNPQKTKVLLSIYPIFFFIGNIAFILVKYIKIVWNQPITHTISFRICNWENYLHTL